MRQTGLYIHIPFCVRKCRYCDFLSFPAKELQRERYVNALCREISQTWELFPEICEIDTIFIGGGTPSLLSGSQVKKILQHVRAEVFVNPMAEISMECNPGTVTQEDLMEYRDAGVNRLSFGVQSLRPQELKMLGRIHTREDAFEVYHMARKAGFENINLDLMSGIPNQTVESYEQTLLEVCELAPEHMSAYSLIIEEGTPFYEQYAQNPPVSEETDRYMYERTKQLLFQYGYNRYEISNYAKSGKESRHNLKYWSGEDYLGVGLGASSKIRNIRYKNETDWNRYLTLCQQKLSVKEVEEELSKEDEIAEFFVLGLRRMKGVSRQEFSRLFSCEIENYYEESLRKLKQMGLLQEENGWIFLSEKGIDVSNYVFGHFI